MPCQRLRMDNVDIVVESLDEAVAVFTEPGLVRSRKKTGHAPVSIGERHGWRGTQSSGRPLRRT